MLSKELLSIANSVSEEEVVDIAKELIQIPSFTGKETPLAHHIKALLDTHGIDNFLQEVEPGRFQVIGWLGPDPRIEKSALLFNGHLDIDPLGREWKDPFTARRDEDVLYGAGIHNMKSGLAAILAVALAIKRSSHTLKRPLLLEFVVGELQGGKGTRFALDHGLTADAAVVPEPYSVKHILTRTAGVHKFAVVVEGKTAHTSRHTEGVDAIRVLRDVLDIFDAARLKLHDKDFPDLPRLQIGSILGGRGDECDLSGISNCADKAVALIDLRYPPPYTPKQVEKAITAVISQAKKQHPEAAIRIDHPPEARFHVGGTDMPPMDESPESLIVHQIQELLPQVSDFQVEKTGVVLPYAYCGNDTTHLSRAGISSCLFGPRGNLASSEDHVYVSEMLACAKTLTGLALLKCLTN